MTINLVNIMMPAYNTEQFIGQAIESILSQTFTDWQLIVVNDGSTDRTAEIAAAYKEPRIRLIDQPNGGEALARNRALQEMSGKYVAFLDADDQFLPEHLELCVDTLEKRPDLGAVYTDGIHITSASERLKPLSSRRRGPFEGIIFEEVVRASDVFGPPICTVLRRSIITEHDLWFDPQIIIGPDWDFLTRFSQYGAFGYIDQMTCLYRIHQSNITVRTGSQRRALSLARCRENAIQLSRFSTLTDETRVSVFYDLLVNQLAGFAERQANITNWQQFKNLPIKQQSRILRIIATQDIEAGRNHEYLNVWLNRALRLNAGDLRNLSVSALFWMSPAICQAVLRTRQALHPRQYNASPFGDL